MEKESWLSIPEWRGRYEVSDAGRVRLTASKRLCGLWKGKRGYVWVRLSQPRRVVAVHRLVAEAFVPNPDNKPNVNHIDCNPSNNPAANLEWCTQKENLAHSERLGRVKRGYGKGVRSRRASLTDDQVREARSLHARGAHSFAELASQFSLSKRSIGRIINREYYRDVQ